jgi:NADPH-dependent glutamate synthase beta subunit-like oxidoreductase
MSGVDYIVRRCLHDGMTLVRLPQHVDPRGPIEQDALHRAYTEQAWRRLREQPQHAAAPIPRNVLVFGSTTK